MMAIMNMLRRRLNHEGGFTIVEAMISITVLAVGALAVAQSVTFGLESTGLARNRLAARAGLEQQMELARALNYDSLVLDDSTALTHSTASTNPDYWISSGSESFDPDGSGSMTAEPIIRTAGASPALHHLQTPYIQGSTTFTVYMYITWFDSAADGLGASDQADGNGDGIDDANGHDGKRVVAVVTWTDPVTGAPQEQRMMTLVSNGVISYNGTNANTTGTTVNSPPTVSCPGSTFSDLDYAFTANATDSDGTVTQIDWNIYDSSNVLLNTYTNQGATLAYSFPDDGTYYIVNSAMDNNGATANNDVLDCNVTASTTSNNAAGNGGPSGTIVIAAGATYTTTAQVTLTLSSATAAKMQFSSDGSTWATKVTYATTSLFTMPTGDGTKTVYVRFWNAGNKYGARASDTIVLDTTVPGAPTSLIKTAAACTTSGPDKTCTLSWTAPSPLPGDLAGYRVYVRNTTSSTWAQQTCGGSGTTCTATQKKNNNYEFYVVSFDNAGNQSAQSNHITVAY